MCVYFTFYFVDASFVENLAETILMTYGFAYIIVSYDCLHYAYHFINGDVVDKFDSSQKVVPTIPRSVNL